MENVINNIIWRAAMKKLSMTKMADTIISKRKELKMTQKELAEKLGVTAKALISVFEGKEPDHRLV